ncbi:uncharacterized protein N7473_010411 [Penicillium subrubescens]|uniref:uncharacterized protein n=1 Tax=Penicillium subrubescens TaxID=1316194 RepID=UPI0025459EA4|nr:uncharacterized protein N7473_010411 [Penicillium subrubescens]KAJ5883525.1 hypothetical protein N7473_010411 [Penicillium subrubescens]
MGASIINLSFYNKTAIYCCGTPIIDGDKIVCPDNPTSGFEVPSGWPIPGRALLANSTLLDAIATTTSPSATASVSTSSSPSSVPPSSSNSTATCSTCHETAIGAGVGAPLGAIALFSIIWALFERRRALKGRGMAPSAGTPFGGPYTNLRDRRNRPVELDNVYRVPELPSSMDSPSEIMSKGSVK